MTSETQTKQDFLKALLKVPFEPTEAMLTGRKVEDDIQAACVTGTELEDPALQEIAEQVRGGIWQCSVSKPIRIAGMDVLLYGKADVIKRDWIYDIKYTGSYDVGKYRDSIQHKLYMLCTGLSHFGYLITDGNHYYREDYHLNDTLEADLSGELATMLDHIYADSDFMGAFEAKWRTREAA